MPFGVRDETGQVIQYKTREAMGSVRHVTFKPEQSKEESVLLSNVLENPTYMSSDSRGSVWSGRQGSE